ncbi:MAG: hypothetical protein R3A10_01400 [Caldilineaceae bacterium]
MITAPHTLAHWPDQPTCPAPSGTAATMKPGHAGRKELWTRAVEEGGGAGWPAISCWRPTRAVDAELRFIIRGTASDRPLPHVPSAAAGTGARRALPAVPSVNNDARAVRRAAPATMTLRQVV